MLEGPEISYTGWPGAIPVCTMGYTAKEEAQDMRDLQRRFGRRRSGRSRTRSGRSSSSSGGRGLVEGVGALELIIGAVAVLIVVVFLLRLIG